MKEPRLEDFTLERFKIEYFIFRNELFSFANAEISRGNLNYEHFFKILDVVEELNKALLFLIEDKWLDTELEKLKV